MKRPPVRASRRARTGERRPRRASLAHYVACLVLAVAALGLAPHALGSAASEPDTADMLTRAERIRIAVDGRYRRTDALTVTEASPTAVVASLTLLDASSGRAQVVPAGHGIYFAICTVRATCPYPTRSPWPVSAVRPRRAAFELALRAFRETTATLVVVALPTSQPVFLVLERRDVVRRADWSRLQASRVGDLDVADASLRPLLDRLSRQRLYAPAGLVSASPTEDSLVLAGLPLDARPSPVAA